MVENNSLGGEQKKKKLWFLFILAAIIVVAAIIVFVVYSRQKRADQTFYQPSKTEEPTEESTVDPDYRPIVPREDVFEHYPEELTLVGDVGLFLDIHREADSESVVIGKYLPYSYVELVQDLGNGWSEIRSQGISGYVISDSLVHGEEAKKLALENAMHRVQVLKEDVSGIDGMSEDSNQLVILVKGDFYDVVQDNQKGYILVHARHNTECYVREDDVLDGYFLNEAIMFTGEGEISDMRLDFLNNAWQYLGGEYVWGGEQLGVGVDCSGYIWKLLEQYGIYIHRVSIEQAEDGREVTEEEMRPGDFVFYIVRENRISHVAIYTGSGRIIHAASEERGIVLDSWDYLVPQAIRNVFD